MFIVGRGDGVLMEHDRCGRKPAPCSKGIVKTVGDGIVDSRACGEMLACVVVFTVVWNLRFEFAFQGLHQPLYPKLVLTV
jgi:hypothetical protein